MERRTFLKGLGAFAMAPATFLKIKVPKKQEIVKDLQHQEYTTKVDVNNYMKGNFQRALWPGIKKWFGVEYKTKFYLNNPPQQFRKLF